MKTLLALGAAAVLVTATLPLVPSFGETPMTNTAKEPAGLHDFDFFWGNWRVHHRRLKERLANSQDWIEFDGTSTARGTMGGAGNMDDNVLEVPGAPYRAVTFRALDPKTGEWLIWWLDGRMPSAPIDPPMRGRFENGVGSFYADDSFNGRPIRVRFLWSRITPNSLHWEQAFSTDRGETWETNWIMDFTRVP